MPKGLSSTDGPLQAPLFADVEDRLDIVDEASDDGWANARCPAHDDENPSMGVKEDTKTGELVVNCRAGCSREKIFLSLGAGENNPRPKTKSGKRKKTTKKSPSGGKLVTTYEYRTPEGLPIALKKRYETPDGGKYFIWADPQDAEKSGLPSGLKESDLPLYNADKVRESKSKRIFFVEGEKSADALEKAYNATAVCLPGGATTHGIPDEQIEVLRSRKVVLWPDNDEAGRNLMRGLLNILKDVVEEIITIAPDVPLKGDAFDYVQDGHTKKELGTEIETALKTPALVEILDGYEVTVPDAGDTIKFSFLNLMSKPGKIEADILVVRASTQIPYSTRQNLQSSSSREGFVRQLSRHYGEDAQAWSRLVDAAYREVQATQRDDDPSEWAFAPVSAGGTYLVKPIVADDGLTVLFGMGGVGKSYVSALLSIITATGKEILGLKAENPGPVIYVDYEASRARLRMRLLALLRGLDMNPELINDEKDLPIHYWAGAGSPLISKVHAIRKKYNQLGARLLVVDSVAKACGDDLNKQEIVSAYTNAIDRIGASSSLSLAHITKDEKDKAPIGSAYWFNDPRLIWNVKRLGNGNGEMGVALYNKKANDDGFVRPLGFTFRFQGNPGAADFTVSVEPADVKMLEEAEELGEPSTLVAIKRALDEAPSGLTPKELEDKGICKANEARSTISRNEEQFEFIPEGQTKRWKTRE